MKIKSDFITNSSSTNFIFLFEGKTFKDFYRLLRKYKSKFRLSWENEITINIEDVINSIKNFLKNNNIQYYKLKIKSLEKFKKEIKEQDLENLDHGLMSLSFQILSRIESMKGMIENKSALEISFGDNDGHISGDPVGTVMDYEGRLIDIMEDDLSIFTEQQR